MGGLEPDWRPSRIKAGENVSLRFVAPATARCGLPAALSSRLEYALGHEHYVAGTECEVIRISAGHLTH
jgi:hypothetical protein